MQEISSDTDQVALAGSEGAARKADLDHGPHQGDSSSEQVGANLKPVLVAGLAVAALAAVAGVTIAVIRRRKPNRYWAPPHRPSALGGAARTAGIFLLRFAARQIASQVVAKLEAPQPLSSASALAARAP